MLTKKELLILLGIAAIGLFLRLLFLPSGGLTFGFDQARDAFSALQIVGGHLKIQGPSASTPGLFHGVAYYYLLAPAYYLGSGSPFIAAIWIVFINILTIIPIFLLGRFLFSAKVGILAAALFAISFDAVQYALWMSNPTPAVFSAAVFYLGLAYYTFGNNQSLKKWGIILSALGLGFSTQFEIFLGYLFVPLIISLFVFKIKPKRDDYILFFTLYILSVSTMLLSYIKFGPTFINGFASLFGGSADPFGNWREFFPTFGLYVNRFVEYFYRGLLPFNVGFAGVIAFLIVGSVIVWVKNGREDSNKLKFLLIMLFSHGLLVPFGGNSTPFINVGLQEIVMVIVAYFLLYFYTKQKFAISLLIALIIFSCLSAIIKYNPQGQTVFAIQRGLTLKNELAAIDYTYQLSGQKPFSINTVTSPLWINTVWSYLYNWYGKSKYGYVPTFRGRDQNGYLGELPATTKNEGTYILIIEPTSGIPQRFVDETVGYEDTFSKVTEEKNFNGIIVQKRELTKQFDQINFIK